MSHAYGIFYCGCHLVPGLAPRVTTYLMPTAFLNRSESPLQN